MTKPINIPYFTYLLPALCFGIMADSLITLSIAWALFYVPPIFVDLRRMTKEIDEDDGEFRI
jgi:hypothetical protein